MTYSNPKSLTITKVKLDLQRYPDLSKPSVYARHLANTNWLQEEVFTLKDSVAIGDSQATLKSEIVANQQALSDASMAPNETVVIHTDSMAATQTLQMCWPQQNII